MDLKLRFGENYILLAGLRQYIEEGIMLSSVNFWRDSFQDFSEFDAIKNRSVIIKKDERFKDNAFLNSFVDEEFPKVSDQINDNVIPVVLRIIEESEGESTAALTKEFLMQYAIFIAKSSKEDFLSFIGFDDSISDEEELFIEKIKHLFND